MHSRFPRRSLRCPWPWLRSLAFALLALFGAATPSTAQTSPAPPTGLPSTLPLRRDADGAWGSEGAGTFQTVVAVMALAGVVGWVLWKQARARRSGLSASAKDWRTWLIANHQAEGLRVVQSTRLTPRASVHLVRWDGKEWMVGCTDAGVRVLGQRPLPAEPEEKA